jgi:ATP synthase alpha/beta family, beta-barrel domain
MADILQELEAQIAGVKTTTSRQNVGVIREIGDGVAIVEGLSDAMLNEMLDLGHGVTGLALNLDETEVGVIVLGDYTQLQEGDEVRTTRWATPSMERDPSKPTSSILSKNSLRALSDGAQSGSPCKLASWRSTQ